MKKGKLVAVTLVSLIMAVVGLLARRAWCEQPYQYLAVKDRNPRPAYDFTLEDQNGRSFSLSNLRGKLVLIDFGFTHCSNICPTTLANLATTYELLSSKDQARIQVLFISLDPSRDTSKVLANYVSFFDKHFIGLTGTPDQIAATAKAYGVGYEQESSSTTTAINGDNIEHSAAVYLVDPSGRSIGFYQNRQLPNRQRVADDLQHFLTLSDQRWDSWQSEEMKVAKAPSASGREIYLQQCASCHLENGRGIPGKYPSLVRSKWVLGAPNRLASLVVNGVKDETDGITYRGLMPAWGTVLAPAETAALLTYIRKAWGNDSPAISTRYVRDLIHKSAAQPKFWSWRELEALPPDSNENASDFDK